MKPSILLEEDAKGPRCRSFQLSTQSAVYSLMVLNKTWNALSHAMKGWLMTSGKQLIEICMTTFIDGLLNMETMFLELTFIAIL